MPTRVLEEIELSALTPAPGRVRRNHGQFNARALLAVLAPSVPDDARSVTALMARDLYVSDAQEYAFGYALHDARVAVVSFAQLDPRFIGRPSATPAPTRMRARGYKLVAHEVGHTLGLEHCDEYRCVMNGVAHVKELDATPLRLGPRCLEKLARVSDRAPAERYDALAAHYDAHRLVDEASWARARARALRAR